MLDIVTCSCMFPSGPNIKLANIALSNQLALYKKHPYCVDRFGQQIKASFFPEPSDFGVERWKQLAHATLLNLLEQLPLSEKEIKQNKYALWITLPNKRRPGMPENADVSIFHYCQNNPLIISESRAFYGSHAAGALALHEAEQFLNQQDDNWRVILTFWKERSFLVFKNHIQINGLHFQ